jgi:hypothetical protein
MEKKKLTFTEAFDKYIKGQKISGIWKTPESLSKKINIQAEGIKCENGYKYVTYGGVSCFGDTNLIYIISPKNEVVAETSW